MKGIFRNVFLFLIWFPTAAVAGPGAYAACQSLAALGCGPAGYAACQTASAASCLATGPGWAVCYAGCQAMCAGLGGSTWAICYGSAQAACAVAFVAPTP